MLLLACVPARAAGLRVLVSIPPAAWFVRQVAGDLAEVQVMIPVGASPHAYEPKPSQMVAVGQADLYLAIGVEFEETWLPKLLGVNPEMQVVHLDEGIAKLSMAEHGHDGYAEKAASHQQGQRQGRESAHGSGQGHGAIAAVAHGEGQGDNAAQALHGSPEGASPHEPHGLDPHVWLSPALAATLVGNANRALAQADPQHAAQYEANARQTLARITALRSELAPLFKDLPLRRFLVFHPSWGYFAHEFGLEQMPIEVQGREPSPRELHDLVRGAKAHGVRAVFVQPQMSRRTAQVVADELGGHVVLADPLAGDWEANLRRVALELAAAMKEEH